MGFLDSLHKIVKGAGEAALATPGAMYDMATYAIPGDFLPGDRGYHDFGDLLNNLGSRANDATLHINDIPVVDSVTGGVMRGAAALAHQTDRAYSTLGMVSEQVGFEMNPGVYFDHEQWAKAWDIADKQNIAESTVALAAAPDTSLNLGMKSAEGIDPETGKKVKVDLTPFQQTPWVQNHPFLANTVATAGDFAFMWFVDPLVIGGKMAGIARQDYALGRVADTQRYNIAERLDGSLTGGKAALGIGNKGVHVDWNGRYDDWVNLLAGDNKLGRPFNAAEVRASSREIQKSSQGLAFSSAMEDALKIQDPTDRLNAARRVAAVAIGDSTQIARLENEIAGVAPIAQKLRNIVSESTVKLQEQALNKARLTSPESSPEFRAAFDRQIANMDESGDLSKFIKDWHAQVQAQEKGLLLIKDTKGTLDYVPGVHKGPLGTNHKLRLAAGETLGPRVQQAHEVVVDRLTRLPQRDSYSTVWQRSLYELPILAVRPTKFMASLLPSNLGPKIVNGLRTVHYNGVINPHDWEAASDQLNSLLIHAGADSESRLKFMSEAYGARTEGERKAVTDRIEQAAVDNVARWASAKHGLDIDREYVQAAAVYGQTSRAARLAATQGGREASTMYSATPMPPEMAMRARNIRRARTLQTIDDKRTAELARRGKTPDQYVDSLLENWVPRTDEWIDSSGVVASMALDTSQLVNRIPLIDIHALKGAVSQRAVAQRLEAHSQSWRELAREKRGLQASLGRATGSNIDRIKRSLDNAAKAQEMLLGSATVMNHWWKVGVLFRLGYPMRVLADDHMRIAARIGYIPFLMANAPEGIKNSFYNYLPGVVPNTRRAGARANFLLAQAKRDELAAHFGRNKAHTDTEWNELQGLIKAHLDGSETASQAARRTALDPENKVAEYSDLQAQAKRLGSSVATRTRNLTKMREESADAAKINVAQVALIEAEGALSHVTEQLAGKLDPNEMRTRIADLNEIIDRGPKGYRGEKRRVGDNKVDLGDGITVGGAFAVPAYRDITSSGQSFDTLLRDSEDMGYRLHATGHWRTVTPEEPGYYELWANILNHQIKNGVAYGAILRGEVKTPQEFAAWLAKPAQRDLRDRVAHYSHDPHDWGGRLLATMDDYVPTTDLAQRLTSGRVSAGQLRRMFPKHDPLRPNIHGQHADIQAGATGVMQAFSNGIQRAIGAISELPTDRLSRHPFFNAVYKMEAKRAKEALVAARGKNAIYTQDDIREIETIARQRALKELKLTLWDISAHSHMAHVMRFLSPFFAAHQEALNRWWNIAKDDPSVARHFQMAFDGVRQTGLVYDSETQQTVGQGAAIGGPTNKIMVKIPWADDNNAVNKWLRKVGGGKYWSVNENGFNLILQNGILNPGVGPLVTIPAESLAQKYVSATEFARAWEALAPYRTAGSGHHLDPFGLIDTGVAQNALVPATLKRLVSLYQGPKSREFSDLLAQNIADDLTTFRLQHDREPTEAERDRLLDKANKQTHTDLWIEFASNAAFFTPAKPQSKYASASIAPTTPNSRFAVVQNGLQRLYDQMRTEGHDMEWLRTTFREKYGDAYMALVYSTGSNPAQLTGSVAEVTAIQRHSALMRRLDPSLARMAIGPEVEDSSKAEQMYSGFARSWLKNTETGDLGTNYIGKKDSRELATSLIVSQGWDMYDQLTNYLDTVADKRGGKAGYEAYPDLVTKKRMGVDYIKAQNPVFAHSYDSYTQRSYDGLFEDIRLIASNKKLAADPTRSDVYWLGQYVKMRDMFTAELERRKASGGAKTMGAEANSDLATAFRNGLQYINSKSPYFKQFSYEGIIERDPYLVSVGGE